MRRVAGSVPEPPGDPLALLEAQGELGRARDLLHADSLATAGRREVRIRLARRAGDLDGAMRALGTPAPGAPNEEHRRQAVQRAAFELSRGASQAAVIALASTQPPEGLEAYVAYLDAEGQS